MSSTYIGVNGSLYKLDKKISEGGEGYIYSIIGNKNLVAKLYKNNILSQRGSELEKKLRYMYMHMPECISKENMYIAWPRDIIYKDGRFIGIITTYLNGFNKELNDMYKYPVTSSTKYRVRLAIELCRTINHIHDSGYVFGDFNPTNIGVSNDGQIAFFDVDTFQVVDNEQHITYKCNVAFPGYVAPELLRKYYAERKEQNNPSKFEYSMMSDPTFIIETDLFALAVHIFRLLMNGYPPYCGVDDKAYVEAQKSGKSTPSPGIGHEAVMNDNYCFKDEMRIPELIPDKNSVTKNIFKLFKDSFREVGYDSYLHRPTAKTWEVVLNEYLKKLDKICEKCKKEYLSDLMDCPYCKADSRYENHIKSLQSNSPMLNKTDDVIISDTCVIFLCGVTKYFHSYLGDLKYQETTLESFCVEKGTTLSNPWNNSLYHMYMSINRLSDILYLDLELCNVWLPSRVITNDLTLYYLEAEYQCSVVELYESHHFKRTFVGCIYVVVGDCLSNGYSSFLFDWKQLKLYDYDFNICVSNDMTIRADKKLYFKRRDYRKNNV